MRNTGEGTWRLPWSRRSRLAFAATTCITASGRALLPQPAHGPRGLALLSSLHAPRLHAPCQHREAGSLIRASNVEVAAVHLGKLEISCNLPARKPASVERALRRHRRLRAPKHPAARESQVGGCSSAGWCSQGSEVPAKAHAQRNGGLPAGVEPSRQPAHKRQFSSGKNMHSSPGERATQPHSTQLRQTTPHHTHR